MEFMNMRNQKLKIIKKKIYAQYWMDTMTIYPLALINYSGKA
jgi:hypothetical protein